MTDTDRLAAALLEHLIGPGRRCACGFFVADGDHYRLARHIATAIAADPTLICPDPGAHADDPQMRQTIENLIRSNDHALEAWRLAESELATRTAERDAARQQGCPDPADHALADAVRPWLAFLRAEAPCPECGHDDGDHVAYCAADGASACGCLVDITAAPGADR